MKTCLIIALVLINIGLIYIGLYYTPRSISVMGIVALGMSAHDGYEYNGITMDKLANRILIWIKGESLRL